MKLLAAELRGICGILRSLLSCFAKATQDSIAFTPASPAAGYSAKEKRRVSLLNSSEGSVGVNEHQVNVC